jgi:hypothetical protein
MRDIGLHGIRVASGTGSHARRQRQSTLPWTYGHRTRALLYADDDEIIRVVPAIGNSDISYCSLYDAGMAHDDLRPFTGSHDARRRFHG